MSYIIRRYQLSAAGWPITLNQNSINDTNTSLTLIGRFYIGWGEFFNNNFVHLLENFAGPNPPANPITGQLWFDTNTKTIKVYNEENSSWSGIGASFGTSLPTSGNEGDMSIVLNSNERALYRYDGTNWIPVLRLFVSSVVPTLTPHNGDIWYNTSSNTLNIYYSGSWNNVTGSGGGAGGGGGGVSIERIVHTTLSGVDIIVIEADNQILGVYSPTNLASAVLGTYVTVKSGASINLSSVFPNGLKVGFNASSLFNRYVFQNSLTFGTETSNKLTFVASNQPYYELDPAINRNVFHRPLRIYTSGNQYFDTPLSEGSHGSVLTFNAATKQAYWQELGALVSAVATQITENRLKIQFNKVRNQITDWPVINNLLLYYFEDDSCYWYGTMSGNYTPFDLSPATSGIPINFEIRTIGLSNSAKSLKIIGGSLLSFHCVDEENNVFMFGRNNNGQLGIGNTSTPIRVWTKSIGLPKQNIKEIIKTGLDIGTDRETTFAWFENGMLYSCGYNNAGTCAVNSTADNIQAFTRCMVEDPTLSASPFYISDVKLMSVGFGRRVHVVAYVSSSSIQKVYAAGRNNKGQLGIGNTTNRQVFTPTLGLPPLSPTNRVVAIKTGGYENGSPATPYTMVLLQDGTLWACGYNGHGNLGLGDTVDRNSFVQTGVGLGTITNVWCMIKNGNTFIEVYNGTKYVYYATGRNDDGCLGLGSTSQINSWTAINSLNNLLLPNERVLRFICCSKDETCVLCWTNHNRIFVAGKNAGVFLNGSLTNVLTFQPVQLPKFEGNIINALVFYTTVDDPGLVALFTDKDYIIYGGRTHNVTNIFIPGHNLRLFNSFNSGGVTAIKGMYALKIPRP